MCGADWISRRAQFGIEVPLARVRKSPETPPLTEPWSAPEGSGACTQTTSGVEPRLDEDRVYERLKGEEEKAGEVHWGGFFRRSCAFFIDVAVLLAFSLFLFYVTHVAYTVGLAAHGQPATAGDLGFFLRILVFAWFSLVSGYFVLLHGIEGRTVGKWLLGLRVIGVYRTPITYSQALTRWFGTVVSAIFGLGFFWILFNQEKRGWHDLLARTWVIRDLGSTRYERD
ncbi:MAG: RDD family protein [Candidatus Binatia bacterium]